MATRGILHALRDTHHTLTVSNNIKMNIGTTIGKYLIQKKIGQGGMGCVLQVQNQENGELYALKYCFDCYFS